MPGRSFSTPSYRYGFNGQEKDDEVYGSGNLNTAQFWEYDTRLGRRWNVDPVVKEWQSPYCTFSGNPILRIDPNGDDDHFNSSGVFIKSDENKTHNILIAVGDNEVMLSQLNLFEGMNAKIAATVIAYYGQQVNKESKQIYGVDRYAKKDEKTAYYSSKKDGIFVAADGGYVSSQADDFYNLKSVLDHENTHRKDHKAAKAPTYILHYRVYLSQVFKSENFGRATQNFQIGIIASTVNHLLNAYHQDKPFQYEKDGIIFDIGNLNDIIKHYKAKVNVSEDKLSFTISYIDQKTQGEVTTRPIKYEKLSGPEK